MDSNHVKVSTDFKDGETGVIIEGVPVPGDQVVQTSTPGEFVIDENNPLKIGLVQDNKVLNPRESLQTSRDGKSAVFRFYIKLESPFDYHFDICMDESGWIISRKSCSLSCKPVLISRLPKKLNKWFVRLPLLPIELAWMLIKFPVKFVMCAVKMLFYVYEPGNVNITVGSQEG